MSVVVWRMCYPAHTGNEVSCTVALLNVCAVWPYRFCVLSCGSRRHLTESWCPGDTSALLASSPGHSHLFNVAHRKERGPGTRRHVREREMVREGLMSVGRATNRRVLPTHMPPRLAVQR